MDMQNNNMLKMAVLVIGALVLLYILKNKSEGFQTKSELVPEMNIEESDVPQIAEAELLEQRQDQPDIEASELLPKDENTIWDQVNPRAGKGSVSYKNFLESGNMFGIDTQGSSLRNANQQLRSEPLIKQAEISPWQQSTIDPDTYRKPLESSCRQ